MNIEETIIKQWESDGIYQEIVECSLEVNHSIISKIEDYLNYINKINNKYDINVDDLTEYQNKNVEKIKRKKYIKYYLCSCFFPYKVVIANSVKDILHFIPIKNGINFMRVVEDDNEDNEDGNGDKILFGFDTFYECLMNDFKNPTRKSLIKKCEIMTHSIKESSKYEMDFMLAENIIQKLKVVDSFYESLKKNYDIEPYLDHGAVVSILADVIHNNISDNNIPPNPFGEET